MNSYTGMQMSKPKVAAIIQARMASSRLPGKILTMLGHQPALEWMINRVGRSKLVDQVIIATTSDPSDDVVQTFCEDRSITCYRGDMYDVLDRVYQAAKQNKADVVLRLTGDCPFIDPEMLDDLIHMFLSIEPPLDFAANRLPMERTVPIGLDAEICSIGALEKVWQESTVKHHREHVMPYFYENPEKFNIMHLENDPDYGHLRWTLDTSEDLLMLQKVAEHFDGRDDFSWLEVLKLIEEKPEIQEINTGVRHKDYREVDERK
jgi:spore coat polysaccharide biosynthesis protein SpsF